MGRLSKNNPRPARECQNCKKGHNIYKPKLNCKDCHWGHTCENFEYDYGVKSYNFKKRK